MDDSLVLAVLKVDIQTSVALLASGACTNTITPSGSPLLHLAISLEPEYQAEALVQLLLINGADPELQDKEGKTAIDVASLLDRTGIMKMLDAFTSRPTKHESNVTVTFHKYVFEEEEKETNKVENPCSMSAVTPSKTGVDFLEKVAGIFQDELQGLKDEEPSLLHKADNELSSVIAELDCVGFKGSSRFLANSTLDFKDVAFTCSTLRKGGLISPSLDTSSVSSIHSLRGKSCHNKFSAIRSPCKSLKTRKPLGVRKREVDDKAHGIGTMGKKLLLSGPDSHDISFNDSIYSHSFITCKSSLEQSAGQIANSSLLTVCEEFLISDRMEGVNMLEKRMPSLLKVALQDQTLLDELQTESEKLVGEQSYLAVDSMCSMTSVDIREGLDQYGEGPLGPITSSTRTAYLRRLKKLKLGLVVPSNVIDGTYPRPLAASLKNISSITREWTRLNAIEAEMASVFNNIPTEIADKINMLTRETACKASFNYMLLDPRVTQNLPMRVFSRSDQELWRTFVAAIFYVGKGSRSRPFEHLYEALKVKRDKKKSKLSEKISKIHDIWAENKGIVVLQVFQNTIAVEAFTREAALIDAVGCANLTNVLGGNYYGVAADWSDEKKLELGTLLAFKAFKIFLQEGERQIRPVDLRSS